MLCNWSDIHHEGVVKLLDVYKRQSRYSGLFRLPYSQRFLALSAYPSSFVFSGIPFLGNLLVSICQDVSSTFPLQMFSMSLNVSSFVFKKFVYHFLSVCSSLYTFSLALSHTTKEFHFRVLYATNIFLIQYLECPLIR